MLCHHSAQWVTTCADKDRLTHPSVGRDGCPNHHRHANELERVARANQHVQFYDCQGRMNERYLLHNVLQSLYPAQPPSDDEILNPKYDHPPPAYYA